ncbi:MAG: hypothetical protein AB1696_14230 [Planctomycetota bacterium]
MVGVVSLSLGLQGAQVAANDGATLTATVEHDFAPWDSPAFALWISADKCGGQTNSWIYLRIWQEPEKSKRLFVFPDKTAKIGAVIYYPNLKSRQSINWEKQPRQELKGSVRFTRVSEKEPVLGEFDFISDQNVHLQGKFEAQWVGGRVPMLGGN